MTSKSSTISIIGAPSSHGAGRLAPSLSLSCRHFFLVLPSPFTLPFHCVGSLLYRKMGWGGWVGGWTVDSRLDGGHPRMATPIHREQGSSTTALASVQAA
jgi:hypothetical protein